MATITNFSQFIDDLGETDTETIDCLYLAVKEGNDYGWFSVWEKPTGMYVKSIVGNDTLWLATAEAKKAFLNTLEYRFKRERGHATYYDLFKRPPKNN
jgi:hypothetical protein